MKPIDAQILKRRLLSIAGVIGKRKRIRPDQFWQIIFKTVNTLESGA